MTKTHKIRLDPNQKQIRQLNNYFGVARYTYNWAIDQTKKFFNSKDKIMLNAYFKNFETLKSTVGYEFLNSIPKSISDETIIYFFKFLNKNKISNINRLPSIKKNSYKESFRLKLSDCNFIDNHLQIGYIENIKMVEELRFEGDIKSIVITRCSGRYFASISVDTLNDYEDKQKIIDSVTVTLEPKSFRLSTGEIIPFPIKYLNLGGRLKLYKNKRKSKQHDSNHSKMLSSQISRLMLRMEDIKKDFLAKVAHHLVTFHNEINFEFSDSVSSKKKYKIEHNFLKVLKSIVAYKTKWSINQRLMETQIQIPSSDVAYIRG